MGVGDKLPTVILGPLLSASLRETKQLRKVGAGDSSPGCTLAWEKPKAHPPLPRLHTGRFLAEGADMLWNQTLGQAWGLLCHRLVVRLRERLDRKGGVPRLRTPFSSSAYVL